MNSLSVDSDEAMKWGDEALNSSSLQFLRSVKHFIISLLQFFIQRKCFIATIFYSAFNASSPLLFKENHHLMLLQCYFYFFEEIERLMLHRWYFLK